MILALYIYAEHANIRAMVMMM